ncbi:MAG: ATP-binding protein [Planctomycetota bacterium]|nr:ATP-binding protein [Planctomycetota bacterium]
MHQQVLRIINETKNLSLVRKSLSKFIEESPFPRDSRNRIILAVDEAIANVVEHAYGSEKGLIQITLTLDDEKLTVGVCDHGSDFKPNVKEDPDINVHIRLGLKGGLGMFLMRRVMDEVSYSATPQYQNQLSMIKFLPQSESENS